MYARRIKLRYNGGNIQLTIPRDLVRELRLAPGMFVDLFCDSNDQLIVDLPADRSKIFVYPEEIIAATEAAQAEAEAQNLEPAA
jgi:hypothetical protein